MANTEDIRRIIDQEREIVFPAFDEDTAFGLLQRVRESARANAWPIVCDVRLWDRPLCYFAAPGSTGDNPVWARRKSNTVQRLLRSSYRATLEVDAPDRMFPPSRNLPVADFALSGGSFPVRVTGAGIIGAVTVSGLHERDDHEVVVAAMCGALGLDPAAHALPPRGA